jgi:DNA-binding response OmpR family regulator
MATVAPQDVRPGGCPVVLLVESDTDNRNMYAEYLSLYGFIVQTADTTDDGLRDARDADVVVTEILVDGSFDGIELVRRLRDSEDTKDRRIVVLTACVSERNRQVAEAAGCDVFLPKPCLPDRLVSEIRAIRSSTSA